jgi:hypothetical protein
MSPTPFFFHRIHYLAASLRLNGGALADANIVVTLGDDSPAFNPAQRYPWSQQYPIEWRWLPRDLFRQHSYFATRLYRFTYEYRAEAVLLLDADVLIAAPFDDLIERVIGERKLFGVPANSTPVRGEFTWEKLFTHAGLGAVPYAVEHSGFGCTFHDPAKRLAPPYFNFGVLPMPADHARRIGATIFAELETVASLENFFRGQMSTTLAIVRQRIPWDTMSFKYNFVNDERYLLRYQREFEDVRLIHFLNNNTIHKDRTFTSAETVEQVLAGTYTNRVDQKFIETLRPIHHQVIKDL